ncbi:MAG: hypothetical protein ACLFO1_07165 [Spirochaetaceae bacterium]
MGFVEFERPRRADSREPVVKLTKQQTFRINKATLDRYFAEATHAVLMFNEDTNQIAIRPSDGREHYAYRLRTQGAQKEISGNAFLQHFRIRVPEQSKVFTPQFDEQLNAVILTEPVETQ